MILLPDDMALGMLSSDECPRPYGWDLAVDLGRCDRGRLDDPACVEQWFTTLCEAINMKPYGDPMVRNFGSGNVAGLTGVQLWETSDCTIHCAPNRAYNDSAYASIFACRPFDPRHAANITAEIFDAKLMHTNMRVRRPPTSRV